MIVLKKIAIGIISIFVLIIVLALIFGESDPETTDLPTENETSDTQTNSNLEESAEEDKPKSNNEEFTVEHDEKYLATREMIWKFLLDKGYKVETIIGVPNIGKTDAKLDEGYEGWYAFIEQNGEWIEFSVVLYNGEVAGIQPAKR